MQKSLAVFFRFNIENSPMRQLRHLSCVVVLGTELSNNSNKLDYEKFCFANFLIILKIMITGELVILDMEFKQQYVSLDSA